LVYRIYIRHFEILSNIYSIIEYIFDSLLVVESIFDGIEYIFDIIEYNYIRYSSHIRYIMHMHCCDLLNWASRRIKIPCSWRSARHVCSN